MSSKQTYIYYLFFGVSVSTESEAILEEKLIAQLMEDGYERVIINDEKELNSNFKKQLEKLNKVSLTDDEFTRVFNYLNEGTIFDKAKKLRDKYALERDEKIIYLKFLNQKDWCKNLFQVSNQITIKGKYENRYDVTLLINGLPLVQIELKRRGMNIKEAFNQIKRYSLHSYKGLFNYIQIFVISNGIDTKYFSNGTSSDIKFEFTFNWKDENNRNIHSLEEFTNTFLEKCNLAKMISKYMVLNESSKTLMVLRAYQKYAVEAVLNQALEVKQNGYVWHTTGSGKTLTSFKVSQLLAEEESIYKVIFVVDRQDLDVQTNKEFNSFCPGCVDGTNHTGALVKNLLSEKNKLVTTTIQKLSRAVKNKNTQKRLDKIKDKNIVFIFDECHRSQFGEMHQTVTDFFKNSLCYGFTGTPIFKENSYGGKTTKSIFGKKLHSYVIKDAIADQNVLGFSVDYVGGAKLKDEVEGEVSAINTQEALENENRLSQIVDNIIESYDNKTRNREFNAIFAVPPKGFIHKYYELFKKKEHDLKIAAIFTYKANEDLDEVSEHSRDLLDIYMDDYNKNFGTNFSTDTFKEYHADVSKRMKNREIDLLLVINMFLTGFDSKLLNTLYVDKNLEYHSLLQAFSRTNRIYNLRKSQGNIVCYRYMKEDTDKAIKLFSNEDAIEDIIMPPYEYFVKKFNDELIEFYKTVKTVEDALNISSEKQTENFVIRFRELSRIKNKLDIFTEFTFDDLNMDEQEFNDFKSVYLDIHDSNGNPADGKVSILDDIDFELELLRNDKINVDYIIELLKDLEVGGASFEHDKERIMNLMSETEQLRNKRELIEKFIDEKLGNIDKKQVTVEEAFDKFMRDERRSAICDIVEEENLKEDVARKIFDNYEFSGKLDNDMIKESFNENLKFKARKNKVQVIKDKIKELFDIFDY